MKKALIISIAIMMATISFGVPFENMKFNQEIDTNAVKALTSNNDGSIYMVAGQNNIEIPPSDGINFIVQEDGVVNFNFQEEILGQQLGNPLSRIFINGKTLYQTIDELVAQKVSEQLVGVATSEAITNTIRGMVYNPLWGKKLAVIGDSLISSPTRETSYPAYIAQRNNMVLVHNGRSGEKLCLDRVNELGQVTNPSCIGSYSNDIPVDADFILCQIGANDGNFDESVDDADMTTNTFKGCWNLLIVGIKTKYPNAKVGFILANNWSENLGQKSEDVIQSSDTYRRKMTQWQKIQCQKLNVPVFDPNEDTRMFIYHHVQYPTNGTTVTTTTIDDSALDWYDKTKR